MVVEDAVIEDVGVTGSGTDVTVVDAATEDPTGTSPVVDTLVSAAHDPATSSNARSEIRELRDCTMPSGQSLFPVEPIVPTRM
jgi:hypothetical protein